MDLSAYQSWFVLTHVLAVFGFLAAHGVSMGVWWRLRRERDRAKLTTLLEFSGSTFVAMSIFGLLFIITGIVAGIGGGWWFNGQWWLWISIALLIVVIGAMTPLMAMPLNAVRRGLGIPLAADEKAGVVPEPVDDAELERLLRNPRPGIGAAIGIGGIALITWLMEMKPL
jgi:energy-coupling factor transporter transmembrane protein EcfT